MKITVANIARREWYAETGSITWGFGFEVSHYGWPDEAGAVHREGWQLSLVVGPWDVSIFSAGAAAQVFSAESRRQMGLVTRI